MSNFPPRQHPMLGPGGLITDIWHKYFLSLLGGSGGAAPASGTFVLTSPNASLSFSSVLTDSNTITLNTTTTGQVSFDYAGTFLQTASVVLTNSQILALPTTPVEIVSAPGAGFRIRPFAASLSTDTSGGAYTGLNATYVDLHFSLDVEYVGYGPIDDSTVTPALTLVSFLLAVGDRRMYDQLVPAVAAYAPAGGLQYVQNPNGFLRSRQENTPLMLAMDNNGSGNLGGGHAVNTLRVTVYYAVESV